MKKSLLLILVALLISMTLPPSPNVAAKTNRAVTLSKAAMPDLIVYWSLVPQETKEQLKAGKFEIRIKNQGDADAGPSYVRVTVTHFASAGSRPVLKTFRAQVPAIKAGQTADVVIETGLDLTLDSSCTMADVGKQVAESNEDNNSVCSKVDT